MMNRNPTLATVLTLFLAATCPARSAEPKRPDKSEAPVSNAKPKRILFLGNSITNHAPNLKIGWPHHWGMAASAKEKDYVHLLLGALTTAFGRRPEPMIATISDFERSRGGGYDVTTKLKKEIAFKADLIILAIGENVPKLKTEESKKELTNNLRKLLAAFRRDDGGPALFVRSSFWPDKVKDGILRKVCTEAGGTYVDISELGTDESNFARSERRIPHAGVGHHPGDKGMKGIADALQRAITAAQ